MPRHRWDAKASTVGAPRKPKAKIRKWQWLLAGAVPLSQRATPTGNAIQRGYTHALSLQYNCRIRASWRRTRLELRHRPIRGAANTNFQPPIRGPRDSRTAVKASKNNAPTLSGHPADSIQHKQTVTCARSGCPRRSPSLGQSRSSPRSHRSPDHPRRGAPQQRTPATSLEYTAHTRRGNTGQTQGFR